MYHSKSACSLLPPSISTSIPGAPTELWKLLWGHPPFPFLYAPLLGAWPLPTFLLKNTTWLYFSSSLATVSVSLNRSCSSLQGRSSVSNCSLHWSLSRDWEAPEGNEAQILLPARCFHPRSALRLLPLTLEPSSFPPNQHCLSLYLYVGLFSRDPS